MRYFGGTFLFVFCIFFKVHASGNVPTNLDKARAVMNLIIESLFEKFDKEALTKGLIHFSKVIGDKDIYEQWYKLSETDRECAVSYKNLLHAQILNGTACPTPNEAVKLMQDKCPSIKDTIQTVNDKQMAKMAELPGMLKKCVGEIPQSMEMVLAKLMIAAKRLFENCNFLNLEKVRAELLPVVEQRMKIPDADLEKLAKSIPDLAPALTGDLKKYVNIKMEVLTQFFKNGNLDFMGHIKAMRAMIKLTPFKQQIFKKMCEKVMAMKEQELPDFVVKGIEKDIRGYVDSMEKFLKEE